jgi:hypothetical protein
MNAQQARSAAIQKAAEILAAKVEAVEKLIEAAVQKGKMTVRISSISQEVKAVFVARGYKVEEKRNWNCSSGDRHSAEPEEWVEISWG